MSTGERIVYESRVLRIDSVAPATRAFFLTRPAGLSFLPGQFLSFLLPVDGATLTKPYTIASDPEDSSALEIVLNHVPGGLGSGYLFDLNPGATLQYTGPWGTFTLKEAPPGECVFLADGTGIAAIRPMLHRVLVRPGAHAVRLHHAAESPELLLYRDEFEALAQQHTRFAYEPLAGIDLEAHVEQRYIAGDSDRTRHFFICGVGDLVPRLRDLLRRSGYERRAVQYEKW